jgi:hypothetical protein
MTVIPKAEWIAYSRQVTQRLADRLVEIEGASLLFGAQPQPIWVQLTGLVYDPKNDLFEVAMDGLNHSVRQPCEIHATRSVNGLEKLIIIDASGRRHFMRFREPLRLPPPDYSFAL